MSFMEKRRRRRPLTREHLLGIANYLTYGRIAVVPVVVVVMMGINDFDVHHLARNQLLSWIAMWIVTIAQLSDVVDGYYARKFDVVSSFGKFIDPLADKLLSMSVLIMLIPLHRVAAWIVVLVMVREVTITALRSVAAAEGVEIAASDWGKRKTVIQTFTLGALLVHYPFWGIHPRPIGTVLLWLTLLISIGSGMHYIWTFFKEIITRKVVTKNK